MDITVLTDNYTDVLQMQGSDDVRVSWSRLPGYHVPNTGSRA